MLNLSELLASHKVFHDLLIGKLVNGTIDYGQSFGLLTTGLLKEHHLKFLRKDIAVGMLVPLNLSLKQLIVASVVLSMYFPCVATFAVLLKELGIIDLLKSTLVMVLTALITGGLLNMILSVVIN